MMSSSETGKPSPLSISAEGNPGLRRHVGLREDAYEAQAALEVMVADAKKLSDETKNSANEYASNMLRRIHDSVDPSTDPGDYLQAVLNTVHDGQPVGDGVIARLSPMRTQIQSAPTPIGVLGSAYGSMTLGMSAGDMSVRPREQDRESMFDTRTGLRLELPMSNMINFGHSHRRDHLFDRDAQYLGHLGPQNVGVVQWLSDPRIAGTRGEVEEASNVALLGYRSSDDRRHHERHIKTETGFVPVVVYGEIAMSALLANIYERRSGANSPDSALPNLDDLLAAGIGLGLSPDSITNVDSSFEDRLHETFLKNVSSATGQAIKTEFDVRRFPNSSLGLLSSDWPITASPEVMRYTGVNAGEMTTAISAGIEQSFDRLRADDPLDRDWSFSEEEREGRLLEEEARARALSLVAMRYGLIIEPGLLQSETLAAMFTQRLVEKRKEKARHEAFVQQHPYLFTSPAR